MAEELLETGLALGGKYVDATVMFSDIRSFTSLVESQGPEETIDLLNSYYTLMFDAIGRPWRHRQPDARRWPDGGVRRSPAARRPRRARGTSGPRHARAVAGFGRDQTAQGKPEIRIGIGIASGRVIAGYTGTERRVTYTCVGDTVNLAAHLGRARRSSASRS